MLGEGSPFPVKNQAWVLPDPDQSLGSAKIPSLQNLQSVFTGGKALCVLLKTPSIWLAEEEGVSLCAAASDLGLEQVERSQVLTLSHSLMAASRGGGGIRRDNGDLLF